MTVALVVAIFTALIGPLMAYIIAGRKLSGKIGTSEASSLWQESASIREDYRARLAESDARIARLEIRVADEERLNNNLTRENQRLGLKILSYEQIIEELRERIGKLEAENIRLRQGGEW